MAWGLSNECPLFSTNAGRGVYRSAFITTKVGTCSYPTPRVIWPVPGLGIKVTGIVFHGDTRGSTLSVATSAYWGWTTSSYASVTDSIGAACSMIDSTASCINPTAANTASYDAPVAVATVAEMEVAAGNFFVFAPTNVTYSGGLVLEVQYVDL